MGLDTKCRPSRYEDVLGQEATIKILRQFVMDGKAWDQSYLIVGPYGSGKTTLGRILARAMLCDAPVQGGPCDKCSSCLSMLEGGSMDFVEVDAATNTGVEQMRKLTEELQFSTFSGKKKLYLFDEAHRFSQNTLDAMLKPLEEGHLVCIFCTNEPEKMKDTIFSRCAPAFVIHPVTPEQIAARLAAVCKQENIEVQDPALLTIIAEMKECHIRDCLKAVEGLSMLGPITRDSVVSYLHLDQANGYLDVLEALGKDLNATMTAAQVVLKTSSPVTAYEKLAELALMAYQAALGIAKPPIYLDVPRITNIGKQQGLALLGYASRFAARPGHPNPSMLLCDLASLHHTRGQISPDAVVVMASAPTGAQAPVTLSAPSPMKIDAKSGNEGKISKPGGTMAVVPRAGTVNDGRSRDGSGAPTLMPSTSYELSVEDYARILGMSLRAERRKVGGPS